MSVAMIWLGRLLVVGIIGAAIWAFIKTYKEAP
jgi:hypothetical protein